MFKKTKGLAVGSMLFVVFLLFSAAGAAQVLEIEFWHGMTGARLDVLNQVVEGFNESQDQVKIVPVLTGTYEEGLARFLNAYPVGQEPGIVQVYEVGTQAMHDSGMIIPAYQIPGRLGVEWDFGQYVAPIVLYYSRDGNLWSWPFASSTSMVYYNADHFRAAGLNPDQPPTTWVEMHEIGLELIEAGVVENVVAFGWPDWQFENQLALHDQPYANMGSGREGWATEVAWPSDFTKDLFDIWSAMAADNVWIYGGPEYNVNAAFTAGEITFLLQSTSSLDGVMRTVGDDFEVRTTFLPRVEGWPRGNSLIGGNSLYVSNQVSDEELEGIFEFFKYLSQTEVDVFWHKNTGYFPATNAALKELMDTGWFEESPNHLTAFLQILSGRRDSTSAVGTRLGPFVQIREFVREAIERAERGVEHEAALRPSAEAANRLLAEYLEFMD